MVESCFAELEKRLQYTFNSKKLLKQALIHRSYGNENWDYKKVNNERLELLGDAVLDLVVTEYLYLHFTGSSEGDLAKLKSMIVSEPVLAKISRKLGVGNHLLLSKGEELTGGRDRSSILGDVFEAILGAVYLDSNFIIAKEFAIKHLKRFIDHIEENEDLIDFKTILQEFSQREYKVIPFYEVIKEMGPDHRKSFEIAVKINDELMGLGTGRNKKSAEQSAARNACRKLGVKAYEAL